MKFLERKHIYVNNMCAKFQGQKIHKKKDIQSLPTCVAVKKYSLLPTLTPFRGLNFFFYHESFFMKESLC